MAIRVSDDIKGLAPYAPGKPLHEVARELGVRDAVKLASNENALGPPPRALEAMRRALDGLHRYPDGAGRDLREALAARLGVTPGQVILGNGSNEIIELLVRTFMMPGDEAVMADLTFVVFKMAVTAAHGIPVAVSLKNTRHDLEAMADRITPRTRLVFIANPNNPTGTIVRQAEVDAFLKRVPDDVLVVFDEAYREYVTDSAFPDILREAASGRAGNLVILRTFSKIYGLAGLRIGYGVMRADLVEYMDRVRQPFNTNTMAQIAALAALGDEAHLQKSLQLNQEGKAYLAEQLTRLGLTHVPTEANFIFFHVGTSGREVYERLLKDGVIIRPLGGPWLRVTIGRPEENRRFIAALDRKSTRLNSSHIQKSRMPSSA